VSPHDRSLASPDEGPVRPLRKAAARTGEALALAVLVAAPWFYGGVVPQALWALACACNLLLVVLAAVLLLPRRVERPSILANPWFRASAVCLGLFAGFAAFQAVPLPGALARFLSPSMAPLRLEGGAATLSLHPHATRDALAILLSAAALLLAPPLLFARRNRIATALGVLAGVGGVVAAYALLNYLSANQISLHFDRGGFGGRANGPFVNPNHLASYLCVLLGAPLAVMLHVRSRSLSREEEPLGARVAEFLIDLSRNHWKVLASLSLLFMELALVFSMSRSGIVAGGAGIAAFFAAFVALRRRRRGRRYGRLLAGTALLAVLAGTAAWIGLEPLARRYAGTDLSLEDRVSVWAASLSLWADFPVFGTGLGTFADVFPLRQPASIPAHYTFPHSEYVGLLVETGIAGVLALAGAAVCGVAGFLRELAGSDLGRSRHLAACVGIAAAASAAVHGAFDFSLHMPAVGLTFAFVVGIGIASLNESPRQGRHHSRRNWGASGEARPAPSAPPDAPGAGAGGTAKGPEGVRETGPAPRDDEEEDEED
jgi:putative inorganic carbon (HCO3(-)) transporter